MSSIERKGVKKMTVKRLREVLERVENQDLQILIALEGSGVIPERDEDGGGHFVTVVHTVYQTENDIQLIGDIS